MKNPSSPMPSYSGGDPSQATPAQGAQGMPMPQGNPTALRSLVNQGQMLASRMRGAQGMGMPPNGSPQGQMPPGPTAPTMPPQGMSQGAPAMPPGGPQGAPPMGGQLGGMQGPQSGGFVPPQTMPPGAGYPGPQGGGQQAGIQALIQQMRQQGGGASGAPLQSAQ